MKSAVTESQGLKRRLKLEIPVEEVRKSFFKQYERIQKKTRIPGFRQGKAPQNILKQNYGDTARREVLDDLFQTFYPRALKENHIHPAASPALTDIKLKEDQPCALTLELEVHPEIKSLNSLQFKIKKQDTKVTDSEVSSALQRLREFYPEFKDYTEERVAQKGDRLIADMTTCFLNGGEVKKLTFSKGAFNLGVEGLAPGFDRHLAGLKIREEKEFKFTFDKDYPLPEVAGKTCSFKVKVRKIQKKILPELNDELAKKHGKETLLGLEKTVRQRLLQEKEEAARRLMEDEIRDKLIQENPVPIPESAVRERTAALMEKKQKELKEALPPQKLQERLRLEKKEIEETARKSLHFTYLMNKVISDLKIRMTEEDITRRMKEIAPLEDPKKVKTALKTDGRWDSFVIHVIYRKAFSRLIESAELV